MLGLHTVAWTINGKALCVCDTLLGVITIAQDCPVFNAVIIENRNEHNIDTAACSEEDSRPDIR